MRKGTSPAASAKKASAATHQRRHHHHRVLKEKAKNRVDDLQGMLAGLQSARRDGRPADAGLLEEQVHQILREWKAELDQPSPASSAAASAPSSLAKGNGSHSSSDLSSYIRRMLQLNEEEEDDATSKLAELSQAAAVVANPKDEPLDVLEKGVDTTQGGTAAAAALMEEYFATPEMPEHAYLAADQYKNVSLGVQNPAINCMTETNNFEYQQFSMHQELPHTLFLGYDVGRQNGGEFLPVMSEIVPVVPAMCPPPSAFLKPKCALWDCPRPAGGSDWYEDYCSSFHAVLALNEGPPGMTPVLRPGGIDLKDGPLFAALTAKTQGKNVGIPECEGAATAKSPWNAPELFDLLVLNGESLREWLFFDKPRRAFESGNRKQRSLPDYSGRGWHESRKQVMKEFGGLKRSYYMDPQPLSNYEWHLYEYEINNCDACALYRLELKLVDPKKSVKGKIISDPLGDLQLQMDRLNAETNIDNKRSVKGRSKSNPKEVVENVYLDPDVVKQMEDDQKLYSTLNPKAQISEHIGYGPSMHYGYSVDSLNNYYGT